MSSRWFTMNVQQLVWCVHGSAAGLAMEEKSERAEATSLKSSSAESSSDEQEDADTLKTELSKLQAENEMLRNEISELKAEVAKSTVELSSWNKANITLQKICENQKQASDKTGIGFSDSEFF
ncbi:hypothetical protein F511_19777 [Dorcoceras hygrometricum]|uniref:Uncharacterized protein n=1 Tax=Dorcoceras hygrometricum TaxID=472368 RepID=A0A2Z7BS49_9LAMI|nr:hypothetical protein F511_19777 [Dorcoceras hygrometricum]